MRELVIEVDSSDLVAIAITVNGLGLGTGIDRGRVTGARVLIMQDGAIDGCGLGAGTNPRTATTRMALRRVLFIRQPARLVRLANSARLTANVPLQLTRHVWVTFGREWKSFGRHWD